jgi:hypothetical protein
MVDISAISGAMSALKGTKDIIEAMVGLRDAATFREKQLELQSKIMDAQSAVFAANEERTELLTKLSALEKEIAALNHWEEEKQRYQCVSIAKHVVAYVLKEDDEGPDTAGHWLCATCFDDHRKTYLQQVPISTGHSLVVACPRCKSVSYVQGQAHADHANILARFTR